jgi:uncharacterized protein YkwD
MSILRVSSVFGARRPAGTVAAATPVWRRVAYAALAISVAGVALTVSSASADAVFNQRLLELINRERLDAGLAPVVASAELAGIAESAPYDGCEFPVFGRAADMGNRNYFGHEIAGCGKSVSHVLAASGLTYTGVAENIAWGSALSDPLVAAANLHSQLMSSPGHRANLLNPAFNAVGVGSWHTAPGKTWSGGGFPLTNVYIAVEVFAGLPVASPAQGDVFHPLTPARILDTRVGTGAPAAPLRAGATLGVQVAGRGGVPLLGVSSVVMNVTVTGPTETSFLTVFPTGEVRPQASNLNFSAGQTVPNLVTAKLGSSGQLSVYNAVGNAHVIADVAGWYDSGLLGLLGARYHPLTPVRLLDTRQSLGAAVRLGPNDATSVQVAGRGGVPSTGVSAVMMNVTVTGTTTPGFLTVFPSGEALPLASNLNFVGGQTVANAVAVKVGASGQISIYNSAGNTDVIADIAGWFDSNLVNISGARFHPVSPARVLDTRQGTGAAAAPLGAGAGLNVFVTGRGGIPIAGVLAVVMNVTVTAPTSLSYLTVFPGGEALPLTSSLNYVAGQTVANLVVVKVSVDGRVAMYNALGATHVIADVAGWYDSG